MSEAGASLSQDTLAQTLLYPDSAAATDDLIRTGAGAPGLVGLIISLSENALSSLRKLFSMSKSTFSLTDLPTTLVEVLTGKGVHQVGHNLL